jgi:shikimate kinase
MSRQVKNILLVGFMGSGKTAVGKRLASVLDWQFKDTDALVEQQTGLTVNQIFQRRGESYFRDLETQILRGLLGIQSHVIATGGGIVLREQNWELMQELGIVIALEASPEVAYQRVQHMKHRPLLLGEDPYGKIQSLLKEREPFYKKAHYSIFTDNKTISRVVEEILHKLDLH